MPFPSDISGYPQKQCRGFADGDCPPEIEEGPCDKRADFRTPGSTDDTTECRCYKCPKREGVQKNRGCMTAFLARGKNVGQRWDAFPMIDSKMYSLGNELAFIAAVIALTGFSIVCCI